MPERPQFESPPQRHDVSNRFEAGLFARNTLWMFASLVGSRLAGLIIFVLLARRLHQADFGYFVFSLSFVSLFFVFQSVGLNTSLVREIARDRTRAAELFFGGLLLRVVLGVLTIPLVVALGLLLVGSTSARLTVALIALSLFLDDLSSQYQSVFRAFERLRYFAWIELANRWFSTALVALAALFARSVVVASIAYAAGSLGALAVAYVLLRRTFPAVVAGPRDALSSLPLLVTATPLGFAAILNVGVFRIDSIMLQAIRGAKEVAIYGAAFAVFETLAGVSWALSAVALPMMARARARGEAKRALEAVNAVLLTVLLPLAVVTPFCAPSIIHVIYSDRYDPAAEILPVLIAAAVLYVLAQSARVAAVAAGRRVVIVGIAAALLCVNVAANAVAIPLYGFEGAAWTTFATEVLDAVMFVVLVHRIHGRLAIRPLRIPLIAAVVTGLLLLVTGARNVAAITLALAAYPSTYLLLLRWLAPDQLARLRAALTPRRTG